MRHHRRGGSGVLRGTRPRRARGAALGARGSCAVRSVQSHDAALACAAGSGPRAGARHRHGGRVSTGGSLRSGDCRAKRPLRGLGHQPRTFLRYAVGGPVAQRLLQAGIRHAGHGSFHLGRHGLRVRPDQRGRARRRARCGHRAQGRQHRRQERGRLAPRQGAVLSPAGTGPAARVRPRRPGDGREPDGARCRRGDRAFPLGPSVSEAARPAAPPRVFGVTAVGFASFNCVVGAGIFGLPGDVARLLGAAAVLGYLVCTLILALVALCLAECGSRVSSAGGMYAYAATAFGPVAGGVVGTMMWLTNVFASGAVANLWVDTLAQAWPALQQPALRIGLIAALYAVLMGVNVRSSRHGSRASSLLAAVKLVPLLVIIGAGVGHLHPATLHWTRAPSASALGEASALLFFAFIGVESGLQASGEVRDPARTIPRAVLLASSLIAVLYMALQLAAQGVLGDALAS